MLVQEVPYQDIEPVPKDLEPGVPLRNLLPDAGRPPSAHRLPLPVQQVGLVVQGGGTGDTVERKGSGERLQRERGDGVPGGPAQGRQIGDKPLGEETPLPVFPDGGRPRPLAELLPVRRQDHGDVRKDGAGAAQPVQDRQLARRVGDVLVPSHHMRDFHREVVHGRGEEVLKCNLH